MKTDPKTAPKKVVLKSHKKTSLEKRAAPSKKKTTTAAGTQKKEASRTALHHEQYPLTQMQTQMPKASPSQDASNTRVKRAAELVSRAMEKAGLVSGPNRPNMAEKTVGDGVDPAKTPDKNDSVTQYLKDGAAILGKLLDDHDYIPDECVLSAYPENMLKVLSSMPFEFRKTAYRRYLKGIRYFGKVPWPMNQSMEPSRTNDLKSLFRHVQCPEGPGDGHRFALAWLEGWDCQIQPPYENDDEADRMEVIRHGVDKHSGIEFHRDHDEEIQKIESIPELIGQLTNHPFRKEVDKAYFKKLAEMIRSFEKHDSKLKKIAMDAFACGILYCTKIRHPDCQLQYDEEWFSKERVWHWIVVEGLQRHGLDLNRMDLLKALGCANFESYSKSSKKIVKFDLEHSRFTPPISFSSFNKACTSAKKWLIENYNSQVPARDSVIKNYLEKIQAQVKKTERQRKENDEAKENKKLVSEARSKKISQAGQQVKLEQEEAAKVKLQAKRVKATQHIS